MYADEIISKIDGSLFRKQRLTVLNIMNSGNDLGLFTEAESETLEGLVQLLDEIADCCHDVYGIDCLFEDSELERKAEENSYDERIQTYNH